MSRSFRAVVPASLCALGLVAAAGGCTGRPLIPTDPNETTNVVQTFTPLTGIDVLFVIDDSGSMNEEQDNLSMRFDAFLNALVAAEAEFHIAITTTDPRPAEVGRFAGPVIRWTDADPLAAFRAQVDALPPGWGVEAGLYAMESALDAARANPSLGFLRDDALLAVVIVSDEDDCSGYAENSAVDPDTFACFQPGATTPPSVFVDYLVALKGGPRNVLVATFTGGPGAVVIHDPDGNGVPNTGAPGTDGTNGTGIEPACMGTFGYADPGNRYAAFADAFRDSLEADGIPEALHLLETSLCQTDLGAPLGAVAENIVDVLRDTCLNLSIEGYGSTDDDVLPILVRITTEAGDVSELYPGMGFTILEDPSCDVSGLRLVFDVPPADGSTVQVIYQGDVPGAI